MSGEATTGCRIEARPAALHFSGVRPRTRYKERLRIVNTGSRSMRYQRACPSFYSLTMVLRLTIVSLSSSSCIQLEFIKVGLLAPGMAQDIDVVVTPEDYKYSFESIEVMVVAHWDVLELSSDHMWSD